MQNSCCFAEKISNRDFFEKNSVKPPLRTKCYETAGALAMVIVAASDGLMQDHSGHRSGVWEHRMIFPVPLSPRKPPKCKLGRADFYSMVTKTSNCFGKNDQKTFAIALENISTGKFVRLEREFEKVQYICRPSSDLP